MLDPDPHVLKSKFTNELYKLKKEPWKAVDARNGGLEAQK
jgi:hypothetical protein